MLKEFSGGLELTENWVHEVHELDQTKRYNWKSRIFQEVPRERKIYFVSYWIMIYRRSVFLIPGKVQ